MESLPPGTIFWIVFFLAMLTLILIADHLPGGEI